MREIRRRGGRFDLERFTVDLKDRSLYEIQRQAQGYPDAPLLSKILKGIYRPGPVVLAKIAEAAGFTNDRVDYWLGGPEPGAPGGGAESRRFRADVGGTGTSGPDAARGRGGAPSPRGDRVAGLEARMARMEADLSEVRAILGPARNPGYAPVFRRVHSGRLTRPGARPALLN